MKREPTVVFLTIVAIFSVLLLGIIFEVRGQEKAPGLRSGQCLPIARAIEVVKNRFKEEVVFKGTNHQEELVLISHNPLTKSWTALQTHMKGFLCVVAYGGAGGVMPVLHDDRHNKLK